MIVLLAALALPQDAAAIDTGTFIVRQDTVEIAREAFRLTPVRPATGGGWTLTASIRYDRSRPVVVLSPILEIGADSLPHTLQYDVGDPRGPSRILGQLGRGRFTLRVLARASERAREFPADGRTVVLDDSVFALYQIAAWFAAPAPHAAPTALTVILPRGLRREQRAIQDMGPAVTTMSGVPTTLRQLVLSGGVGPETHLWLDPNGRLLKVEVPAQGRSAERTRSP